MKLINKNLKFVFAIIVQPNVLLKDWDPNLLWDYKQYALKWLINCEHLINDFLKFSSLYNNEQVTDYLENKKMLHLKLMGSVEDVILKWSDSFTANTGFVPLAGLLQCN